MIVIAGLGATWFMSKPQPTTPDVPPVVSNEPVPTPVDPNQTTPVTTTPSATMYNDGTYTAEGAYSSPAGNETVTVSVTLANDVITDATFTGNAKNPGSVANQKKFSDGFKAEVVGKSIDSINLTVVNGASLTPKGFMDALSKIKTQAMKPMTN